MIPTGPHEGKAGSILKLPVSFGSLKSSLPSAWRDEEKNLVVCAWNHTMFRL